MSKISMIKGAEGIKINPEFKDKFLKDGWKEVVITEVKGKQVVKFVGLDKDDSENLKKENKKLEATIKKLEAELATLKAPKE